MYYFSGCVGYVEFFSFYYMVESKLLILILADANL